MLAEFPAATSGIHFKLVYWKEGSWIEDEYEPLSDPEPLYSNTKSDTRVEPLYKLNNDWDKLVGGNFSDLNLSSTVEGLLDGENHLPFTSQELLI